MLNYSQHRQSGMHTVEMAIVSSVFFLILFTVLEVGRALFTWNVLEEGVRRGARLAAVCPITSTATIQNRVLFGGDFGLNDSGATVVVEYFGVDGQPETNTGFIRYVRVVVKDFQFRFLIPFVDRVITAPDFTATLPSESLGEAPFGYTSPSCSV